MKWVVQAQIDQMAGGGADARAGSLRYDDGTAPWLAWGPYLWANGTTPRSDGLTWQVSDFNPSDLTHPGAGARQKVADRLMTCFSTAPTARCWFLAGQTCQ